MKQEMAERLAERIIELEHQGEELTTIRRYLVDECGMSDVGSTLDMVRSVGHKCCLMIEDRNHAKRMQVDLELEVATLTEALEKKRASKDGAYAERDRLVAALSKLFPSHLARHPESDTTWENDWRWIICIHLPTGQATWHIHDSELSWFNHLDRYDDWDGHTTEQKYARLAALAAAREAPVYVRCICDHPGDNPNCDVDHDQIRHERGAVRGEPR